MKRALCVQSTEMFPPGQVHQYKQVASLTVPRGRQNIQMWKDHMLGFCPDCVFWSSYSSRRELKIFPEELAAGTGGAC